MAIVSSAIGYAVADDPKDASGSGSTFDFTRRKKWPQLLLQELAGAALFCLKPVRQHRGSNASGGAGGSGQGGAIGWKTIYISPGANDMLSIKGSEFENRDFFDIIYSPDQPHLQLLFQSLISPPPPLQRGSLGIHSGSTSGLGSGSGSGSGSGGGSGTDSTGFGYGARLGMSHTGNNVSGIAGGSGVGTGAGAGHRGVGGTANGSVSGSKGASTAGKSFTTYARINSHSASSSLPSLTLPGVGGSSTGGMCMGTPTAVWEIRAHATGVAGAGGGMSSGVVGDAGNGNFGMTNNMQAQGQAQGWGEDQSLKGKAVWVMGRKVADGNAEDSVQSLDVFLELKLENERLREELRDLQYEMDDEDLAAARAYSDASALRTGGTYPSTTSADPSSPSGSSFTSSSDELSGGNGIGAGGGGAAYGLASGSGAGRKKSRPSTATGTGASALASGAFTANAASTTHLGSSAGAGAGKDKDRDGREKKRAKKQHAALAGSGMGAAGAGVDIGRAGVDKVGAMAGGPGHGHGHGKGEAEGMHVCVTCGRTDSPEWRKGPLGPKTLCNACGLRWAKRNSTAPSRKEKKLAAEAKKKAGGV